MSKVTDIHDALLTDLQALFPEKIRIPNPYSLEDNSELNLINSYGLSIGSASEDDGEFNSVFVLRTFTVSLTKEVFRIETQEDAFDTASKEILEDLKLLRNELCKGDELQVASSIDIIKLGGDSGIEFLLGEKSKFLTITLSFDIGYMEEIA